MQRPGPGIGLVAGVLLGLLAGWWLRGETPAGDAPRVPADAETAKPRATPAATSPTPRRRSSAAEASADPAPVEGSPSAPSAASPDSADPSATPSDATDGASPRGSTPGATDPAAPATPSSAPAAGVPDETKPLREAQGVVVDAVAQTPVAGARVLFAVADGPKAGSWWGDTTDDSGRFHNKVDDARDLGGNGFELRVSKEGFEPVRVAASGGEQRIELRPRTSPVMPGRIVGVARSPDGKPVAGEIEVEAYDENGSNVAQRAVADAGGSFVLDGVPPGSWRMRWNRGAWTAVTVSESGEGRVDLVAGAPGASPGFVITDVDPSKVTSDDPTTKARLATLVRLLEEVGRATELDAGARERVRRALALEVQQIAADGQASLPRRDLAVTGLPAVGRAWLRLETHPRHFRRVEVDSGVARFPGVPVGAYTAVLVEPGRPDRSAAITVPPGDGPLETAFR